jgi:hypothetical protein
MTQRGLSPANQEHVALAVQANPYDPAALSVQHSTTQAWAQPAPVASGAELPSNIALAFGLAAPPVQQAGPPLSPPKQLHEQLWMYGQPWWVAGGWALELWLGRSVREHGDIEIAIPRSDQLALRNYLTQFRFTQVVRDDAGNSSEAALPTGELAGPAVHELHARRYSGAGLEPAALLRFGVLLEEAAEGQWHYRRDRRISLPLDQLAVSSSPGIPCLAPELVLLYKAGSSAGLRPVDEQDFSAVLPLLDPLRRSWLRHALELAHPGHPWLSRL